MADETGFSSFEARSYQVELFHRACEENTIVCLKTGAGKTFIAVMLIKELQHQIVKSFDEGKRTFFLVPKVPLVIQQASVVEDHTMLRVGRFYGEMDVDYWDEVKWRAELERYHVLVMTAQILVNVLNAGYLSMAKINLLVFDECHVATGNHPYCSIMSRYLDFQDGPRILGLTASVLNGKCSLSRIPEMTAKLEVTMHCRIQTSRNLVTVNRYATKPCEVIVVYAVRPHLSRAEERLFQLLREADSRLQPMEVDAKAAEVPASVKELVLGGGGGAPGKEGGVHGPNQFSIANWLLVNRNWVVEHDVDNVMLTSDIFDLSTSPRDIVKNVTHVLFSLGRWCALFAVTKYLEDLPKLQLEAEELLKSGRAAMYNVLHRALLGLREVLLGDHVAWSSSEASAVVDEEEDVVEELTTPKLRRLLEVLRSVAVIGSVCPENFRGIVFVECRVTAWVLSEFLGVVARTNPRRYGYIRPCFVVGHGMNSMFSQRACMNTKKQSEVLEMFRTGEFNLMVATKVVEEGLDIPKCNVVVRFDAPKDYCSYVQSMGRARAERALYLLMVGSDALAALQNEVASYKVIEATLNERCHGREVPTLQETVDFYSERHAVLPFYPTSREGACVSMSDSLSRLNMYVSHLPRDRHTVLKPTYTFAHDRKHGRVSCVVQMPPGCPLQDPVHGQPVEESEKEAKQAAALEVCVLLHRLGELNDNLLPRGRDIQRFLAELGVADEDDDDDEMDTVPDRALSGTRRRRLVYRKAVADDLKGGFPMPDVPLYLHAIKVSGDTSSVVPHREFCFALLSTKAISTVVAFTLFAKKEFHVRFVQGRKPLWLSDLELAELRSFHEVLFGSIVRVAGDCARFLPDVAESSFLVVPVFLLSEPAIDFDIDWHTVRRTVAYQERPPAADDDDDDSAGGGQVVNVPEAGSVVRPLYGGEDICSKRHVILEVRHDLCAADKFPHAAYATFAEYFAVKYGAVVRDVSQPLVLTTYAPNALSHFSPQMLRTATPKSANIVLVSELCETLPLDECSFQHALLLPSVLHRLNGLLLARQLGEALVNEALVAPRADDARLLDATKLELAYCDACKIDDSTIFGCDGDRDGGGGDSCYVVARLRGCLFQALTTSSANCWDDSERLEVIGDAFLKYAVSVFLFCRYDALGEGSLSSLRTAMVRNANLCQYAKRRRISELMNAAAFQPRTGWLPPGYVVPQYLADLLVSRGVPSHLWPFATGPHAGGDQWVEALTDRWEAADPSRKDVAQMLVPDHGVRPCDASAEDDGCRVFVYNRYVEQLIADKVLADSVEAIIGAVLLCCGQRGALRLLNWLGLQMSGYPDGSGDGPEAAAADDDECAWKGPQTALIRPVSKMVACRIYSGLDELEEHLGYTFKDKSFLLQAVVHPSHTRYPATGTYQRLEFLGDAILDYLITMTVYKTYPNLSPGDITDLRSSLVDNATFAYLSVKNGLHKHMRYCSCSLFEAINKYLRHHEKLSHPKDVVYMYSEDDVLELSDVEVPKALGDLFESVAGAVYLDSGLSLKTVWDVFYPLIRDLFDLYSKCLPINPVRKLFECYPSAKFAKPKKVADVYQVTVACKGDQFVGCGRTKVVAKQAAAKCALKAFNMTSTRELCLQDN